MPPKSPKAKKGAQKAAKATKAKPVKVAEPESSEEESDSDDDSEEEAPAKKAVTQTKKKAPLAKAESSDDDSSEEESEEEEAPKPAAKKATKKAAAKKEESSEEDDDSSEEEEASPVNGKAAKAAPAEESDDDEEDSDDEEESEEETSANGDAEKMDTEEAKSKKKRKIEENDKSESKKQKLDEDAAEEEQATLYIGNVPDDIDSKKIEKFFKKNGGIKIAEVRTFEGKRFCYADLEDASQLDAALALAGTDFKGSELKIEKAKPRGQPKKETQAGGGGGREANKDDNTMFVKNMSYNTTKEGLEEFFSDAQEVRVPLNEDGSVRGFAFVQFSSEDEVKQCISEKQGSELDGRALYLDYMGKKSSFGGAKQGGGGGSGRGAKAGDTKILFVKNLSYDTTQESLSDAFEGASSARVATDRDSGRSKGFGFIEYSSPAEATAAFEAMKGATVDGRQIFLDYAAEREGGGGRGGFRGGRGGGGRGGGFRGGRGGGGRGGGFRGGRGGGRGGSRGGFADFKGKRKSFDD